MSVALSSQNGVLVGAFPDVDGVIPSVVVVLSDPDPSIQRVLLAKLSPQDADALSVALGNASNRIREKYEEWQLEASVPDVGW